MDSCGGYAYDYVGYNDGKDDDDSNVDDADDAAVAAVADGGDGDDDEDCDVDPGSYYDDVENIAYDNADNDVTMVATRAMVLMPNPPVMMTSMVTLMTVMIMVVMMTMM